VQHCLPRGIPAGAYLLVFEQIENDPNCAPALPVVPLPQANAYAMLRRRAAAVGIETKMRTLSALFLFMQHHRFSLFNSRKGSLFPLCVPMPPRTLTDSVAWRRLIRAQAPSTNAGFRSLLYLRCYV
jgi:hypothetical protein